MAIESPTESDLLVQFSRRGLWTALALLLVLSGYAIVINGFPESRAAAIAGSLGRILPIAIIIALAATRSSLKGVRVDRRNAAMKAVRNDELHQKSLQRAYRNGFASMLLAQPALAALFSCTALPYPVVLMASATGLVGTAAVLCSMLVYDR
jgi:hypothetical protein